MAKKSKVEQSDYFDEIVTLLSEGYSSRYVSNYLKNEYDEVISYSAINNYKNKHIHIEQRVEAELNRRAKEKEESQKKTEVNINNNIEKEVQHQADVIETNENTVNSVARTIADNMEGVAKVAAQFPKKFEQACSDVKDPNSNVTSKDVARMALDANRLYNDYFKQDGNNVEVNIENHNDLSKVFDIDKQKELLNAKRERYKRDNE